MKLLATYLNDHLAALTGVRELALRARGAHGGTPRGAELALVADEIEAERRALLEVLDRLGLGADRLKQAAGWTAEKLGRLKPNGRLVSRSPLSTLIEIEALGLGTAASVALWRTLAELGDERLADVDLPGLEQRAARRAETLERLRADAAAQAFPG